MKKLVFVMLAIFVGNGETIYCSDGSFTNNGSYFTIIS